MLGNLPAWLWRAVRRHWPRLLLLAVLGGAAAFGGLEAWAWYQFRAGRDALERYHTAEARAHLGWCLRVWPWAAFTEPQLLAARAARRAEAFDEAEEHLNRCSLHGPKEADDVALEWALLRVARGDLDPTVEEALLARSDRNLAELPLIREALAEGYSRLYRTADALTSLEVWLELQPNNPQALALRGKVFRRLGAASKAVPEYRRAVEIDPANDDNRWWLAVCLIEVGRYEEALRHLEILRYRRPNDTDVLVRIARCQNGLNHSDEARQTLDRALALRPDDGLALRTRGQVELQANRPAEAEKWLSRAVRALPYDYTAQWNLVDALKRQGKDSDADVLQKRAELLKDRLDRWSELSNRQMMKRPNDPKLRCEAGTLLLNMGQEDLGERWLLSALELDPDYQPAHAALADLYEKQGKTAEAAEQRRLGGPKLAPALLSGDGKK